MGQMTLEDVGNGLEGKEEEPLSRQRSNEHGMSPSQKII